MSQLVQFFRRHVQLAALFALLALLTLVIPGAAAQEYIFSVPDLRMQVFVQNDASARILYDMTFDNRFGGDSIDIIDIATPHAGYDINNMRASVNENELTDIRVSEFVDPGVEIHLHENAIPSGEQGSFQFEFVMPDMVYEDTTRSDYASLQIANSAFLPEFVIDSTDVWIIVHMLPDIQPEEVLYQDENLPFTNKDIFEERTVVGWRWPDGNAATSYQVGTSFPRRGITGIVEQNVLDLAIKWLEDNPEIHLILGTLTVLLLAVAFFRFSGGTGLVIFVMIAGVAIFLLITYPGSLFLALPFSMAMIGVSQWGLSRRKQRYLPAIAQVEGGGIKRGLTAPEAAIILELPINKVLTLILFGLLEKGIIQLVDDDPLKVRVALEYQSDEPKSKARRNQRLEVAQRLGSVIRTYEHAFIDLLENKENRPVHKINFSDPMLALIKHTAGRLKGFDLSDTQDYYRRIIARAMEQAKELGEIQMKEQYIDRHLQWLLLDDKYPTVFHTPSYNYRPIWIRPFASSDRMGIPSPPSGTVSAPGGKTSFSQVAASFAGWTENTMGKMADAIAPGALQVKSPSGVVNLGGVDKVTGDVFKSLASSSGGSSGGGGSCACACAGCACACACAGGGR